MAISNLGRGLLALLLVCGLLHCAKGQVDGGDAGTVYTVGGDVGWTSQAQNSTFYQDWANNYTFYGNDRLNFTYNGDHDVLVIPEASLATCDNSTVIIKATGSGALLGQFGGTVGFISDVGNDCSQFGMHFLATFLPVPGSPAPSPTSG